MTNPTDELAESDGLSALPEPAYLGDTKHEWSEAFPAAVVAKWKPENRERHSRQFFTADQMREYARACLAGQAAAPAEGWVWMTHPDRNDGEPIPVQLFAEEGELFYRPFDESATDFAWDERDSGWQIVATPPGAAPARAPAAAIPDAIRKLIGTPDDPNIGWRGDGTNEVYACEFCNAKHGDCTKIPHTKNCPVPAAFAALASAPAGAGEGASPTLPADCITVNLVRLAGLDKHKARECDAIVRQVLASRAAGEPAVAAQKGTIGHVGNGKTTLVGALAPILAPAVAAADEGRDYEQTLWLRELFALIEKWHGTRDGTPSKAESFDALWKHAHNIGPHWRARAASQDEHQEKQG